MEAKAKEVAARELVPEKIIHKKAEDVSIGELASSASSKGFCRDYKALFDWLGSSEDANRAILAAAHAIEGLGKKHGVIISEDVAMALIDRFFAAAGPTPEEVIERFARNKGRGKTMGKTDFLRIFHGFRNSRSKKTTIMSGSTTKGYTKKWTCSKGNDPRVNGLLKLPRNSVLAVVLDDMRGKKSRVNFIKSEGGYQDVEGHIVLPRRTLINILEKFYKSNRLPDIKTWFTENFGSRFEDEETQEFYKAVIAVLNNVKGGMAL